MKIKVTRNCGCVLIYENKKSGVDTPNWYWYGTPCNSRHYDVVGPPTPSLFNKEQILNMKGAEVIES